LATVSFDSINDAIIKTSIILSNPSVNVSAKIVDHLKLTSSFQWAIFCVWKVPALHNINGSIRVQIKVGSTLQRTLEQVRFAEVRVFVKIYREKEVRCQVCKNSSRLALTIAPSN